MSDKIEFGLDFSGPIKNIKKNEKLLGEASKSIATQGKMVDNVIAAQTKMLSKMVGVGRGTNISLPRGQIQQRQITRLGGGQSPMQNMPWATIQGTPTGGGRFNVPPSPVTPGASEEFKGQLRVASIGLSGFVGAIHIAQAALSGMAKAGEAGREAGEIRTLAKRAEKVLGGKAALYQGSLDKMGEKERAQAVSFLESAISMKQTQFVQPSLRALEGGLQGIRSGNLKGGDANSLLSNYMFTELDKYNQKGFLTPEMKLRAMEGSIEGMGRNADYTTRAGTRIYEANKELLRLTSPGTMGAADAMTFGGASSAYAADMPIPYVGDGTTRLGATPTPSGASGSRSGDMGSVRGNTAAIEKLTSILSGRADELRRPPVGTGK